MANLLGKRYACASCGAELLCTRPGEGELSCCGVAMVVKASKALPTSD